MSTPLARAGVLQRLGFTELEAEVYAVLVAHHGLTAYAIGRAVAKPTANVYKAVESLARKGAVLVEEGERRVCRAVPPDEVLSAIEGSMRSDIQQAKALLAQAAPPADERVYRLESAEDVIARCVHMLDRARRVAVVDAFPEALRRVRPAVERAVKRGVNTFVEAYGPTSITGAAVAVVGWGDRSIQTWQAEQLNVVVDGREHVAALLSRDLSIVHQAIWSDSLYLSCLMHAGRLAEHSLVRLTGLAGKAPLPPAVARVLRQHPFFATSDVPGHRQIVRRFAPSRAQASSGTRRKQR